MEKEETFHTACKKFTGYGDYVLKA